ncbi:hypothetical protein GA0070216_12834 [Micromonospora matsumotoense]|uniref:Uncharacterized protein n=1 Tax=Micromonospora matsumotoense TaxID=121616 RepID=A0A1C5AU25_9ACTN|nr:hypothetical protein GA0070216_12834 [Micromonospora matsumotoense]
MLRLERAVPAQALTAFRETVRVVLVSVACLVTTAIIAAGVRWAFPERTPNFRGLIREPDAFARTHHVQLAWWALALVMFATILGWVAADPRLARWVSDMNQRAPMKYLTGPTTIRPTSAWYQAFHAYDKPEELPRTASPTGPIYVGAQMNDGTYIYGWLRHYSIRTDEDDSREICLMAPIEMTAANGTKTLLPAHFTIISARNIVRLDVTHLAPPTDPITAPAQEEDPEVQADPV